MKFISLVLALSRAVATTVVLCGTASFGAPSSISNVSAFVQIPPGSGLSPSLGYSTSATTGILLRGVGPSLALFGIKNTAVAPIVQLYSSSGQDVNFIHTANLLDTNAIFASVGAFPLESFSSSAPQVNGQGPVDSVDVENFNPGTYSIRAEDNSKQGGTVLLELYTGAARLAQTYPPQQVVALQGQLSNFSLLVQVPAGGNSSTLGFVLSAQTTLLIRSIGPGLASFGISNFAASPSVTVFSSSGTKLSGIPLVPLNWATVFSSVGAFLPDPGDYYETVVLAPGSYTMQGGDSSGKGGTELLEVYANPVLGQTANSASRGILN